MNTISIKLYPETETLFKKLKDESDTKTADQFLSLLLENYENPRKVEVPKQSDLDRIAELEKAVKTFDESSVIALTEKENRITELEHQVFRAESELTILRDQAPESQLQETQIVFEVTEPELDVIDSIIYKYSKVQEISRADALYSLIRDRKITR
jgi:hypothetical protein